MSKKQLFDEIRNCLYRNGIYEFHYVKNGLKFWILGTTITVKYFYIDLFFFQFTQITYFINGNSEKTEYYFTKRNERTFYPSTLTEIIHDLSWNVWDDYS